MQGIVISSWAEFATLVERPFITHDWMLIARVLSQAAAGFCLMLSAGCRLDRLDGRLAPLKAFYYAGVAALSMGFTVGPWIHGCASWPTIALVICCAGVLWTNRDLWVSGVLPSSQTKASETKREQIRLIA